MNKTELVSRFMSSFNAVDTGMIAALMLANPETWCEITAPSIGARVVLYEGRDEIHGEVHQIIQQDDEHAVIGIDIGEDADMMVIDWTDVDVVVFDDIMPDCQYMFCTKPRAGSELDEDWFDAKALLEMSFLGFRIYESEEFGIFFGIDDDLAKDGEVFELLLDSLGFLPTEERGVCKFCGRSDEQVVKNADEQVGLLICDKCGASYCLDCLRDAVNEVEMKRMVWRGDTLLCPECAKEAGYKR